jgi:hypothetical protein
MTTLRKIKQRQPPLLPAAVVEGFDRFQPRFALAVVDLPQIQHRPINYPATRQAPLLSIAEIGVRFEWHLLKLFGVTIFANVRACMRTWLGEQRVGFWSSLDGPGLDASRAIADTLLRDQHE